MIKSPGLASTLTQSQPWSSSHFMPSSVTLYISLVLYTVHIQYAEKTKQVVLSDYSPCPGSFNRIKLFVVPFRQQVSPLGDNEPTIVGTVGEQVDKTLQAPETGPVRVLILMRPRLANTRKIFTAVQICGQPRCAADRKGCTYLAKEMLMASNDTIRSSVP